MSTTTTERLRAARTALEQARVVDVKFYFNKGSLSSLPPSQVAEKVADFLECYLAGRGTKVTAIGDAPKGAPARAAA